MQKFSAYKRRTVQQMKESLGVAKDVTVDPAFENGYVEFQALAEEMMEVGAASHIFLEQAKLWTNTSQQMSEKFSNYFQGGGSSFSTNAQKFQAANDDIANVVRKSVAIVALEQCLNPLRKFCAERIPDIESRVENRNNLRTDFDSYRRRLKDLQNSKEPDREKLEHLRQKQESAKMQYEKANAELIADFISLKQSKESLLINQATAMFICQQEFFARAAKSLEGALQGLPTGTARKTEKSIEQFVRSGGPDPEAASQAMTANRASFKIMATPVQGGGVVPPSRVSYQAPASQMGNMNITNAPSSYNPPAFNNRPPPPPPAMSKVMAVANYPFEPREAGEVGFAVGDLIEVIEQDDSGWWIGVANGKRGQFPSNYVKLK